MHEHSIYDDETSVKDTFIMKLETKTRHTIIYCYTNYLPGPDLSVWRPWVGPFLLEAPTHPQIL